MVYQDRQPLYFYDLAVHGVFAFVISITLINLFMGTLDNALRSMKSSVTLKLLYKTLKKSKRVPLTLHNSTHFTF